MAQAASMYPYLRVARLLLKHAFRRPQRLDLASEFTMTYRPMLGDLDVYPEVNNGRHFVMFDLARYGVAFPMGLVRYVRRNKLAFVVGGSSIRYRKRVRPFRKAVIRTRLVGLDGKFFYFQHTVQQGDVVCSSALVRAGLRRKGGTAVPTEVMTDLGYTLEPFMEPWVEAWASWDDERPWPTVIAT